MEAFNIIHYPPDEIISKYIKPNFVGCLIVTSDSKILLQKRNDDAHTFPGFLCEFGGKIEKKEQPIEALVRELYEELGAIVDPQEVHDLSIISESITDHSDYIQMYFWQDKNNTITGCYEGQALTFDNIKDILVFPKLMDSVKWLISTCSDLKLLPTKK